MCVSQHEPMIFNIVTAALTYQKYQQNSSDVYVGYPEYVLTVTDIVFNCVSIFICAIAIPLICCCWITELNSSPSSNNKEPRVRGWCIYICAMILNGPFNIVYSVYVIDFYYTHRLVDEQFFNMSLAIIILNPIFIVFYLCL